MNNSFPNTTKKKDEKWSIPTIDNRFICIADMAHAELCAEVSSCFIQNGLYFPVFLFPNVNTIEDDAHTSESDGYISQIIGQETAVLINNSIARMTGCNHVIYVGLSEYQKSYLSKYKLPIIEIQNSEDIKKNLAEHVDLSKEILLCRKEDLLAGLYTAATQGKRLSVDEHASSVQLVHSPYEGIIVVEKHKEHPALSILAVNYAVALNADLHVVDEFSKEDEMRVEQRLQIWQEERNHNRLQKVLNQITRRTQGLDFQQYKYATFFTNGLPYSLGIKNEIPCTHVHLALRPDLFLCNSIGFETGDRFHSAVVFSPQFFSDEETDAVIDTLGKNGYFVRSLVGSDATYRKLDFHAQHFPYDILHICTHGGEVDGYDVTHKFKDRKGKEHVLEYDEVVSFSPVPGKDLIEVASKMIFRKFDGAKWMSPQLKAQKIPQYVFEDMRRVISLANEAPRDIQRMKKAKIPTSCAIVCVDGFHQGTFRILSSHHSPVIYNNSCLSWGQIARFFLSSGSRGYIGTLWSIENSDAITAANVFYGSISTNTVMTSLHKALQSLKGSSSEDIYLYWGLHFTSIKCPTPKNPDDGRSRVFKELVRSLYAWTQKIKSTKSDEVKKNSIQVAQEIYTELTTKFTSQDLEKVDKEFQSFQDANSKPKSKTQSLSAETALQEEESITTKRITTRVF